MTPSRMTRLQRLENALDPLQALLKKDGLSNLLQYAAQLPPRDPWDEPEDDAPLTGMGLLLAEAKAWLAEQEERTC
jgi:hypothetical protein